MYSIWDQLLKKEIEGLVGSMFIFYACFVHLQPVLVSNQKHQISIIIMHVKQYRFLLYADYADASRLLRSHQATGLVKKLHIVFVSSTGNLLHFNSIHPIQL